jgi:cytochrome c oxidase subunit 2
MAAALWTVPAITAHMLTSHGYLNLCLMLRHAVSGGAVVHLAELLNSLSPTSIFDPAGTPARLIQHLSWFVNGLVIGIFIVVGGLLAFIVVRYRGRATDDESEPTQIYGSNQIELSWTVIPILLVFMLFLTTARVILGTERIPKPASALDVVVIGHQFWWEYRYPALGVVTANELHVPVSDPAHPTPTYLSLSSADVTHSFSVPRLAGRMDIIPNRVNTMWIDPEAAGLYLGQCAQYCGTQHAKMLQRVYADSPADFAAWIKQQAAPAADPSTLNPEQLAGKAVFEHNACANCHTIKGTSSQGKFGPDLTHMASRDTLGSGAFANNPQNLHQWIDEPDSFKPGVLMPPMHLSKTDLDAVTAYLITLH